LFIVFSLAGILEVYFITRQDYNEKPVFITYIISILIFITYILLNL